MVSFMYPNWVKLVIFHGFRKIRSNGLSSNPRFVKHLKGHHIEYICLRKEGGCAFIRI